MGYYWATLEERGHNLYCFDTRVYFDSVDFIGANDLSVGIVIGKNPGSALPKDLISDNSNELNLGVD